MRREFVVKNSIALKEARETLYWLRLVAACTGAPSSSLAPLAEESHELVAILTATVKTLKASSRSSTSPSHPREPT